MAIQAIKLEDYEARIANEAEGILIDFWRENCGTCQALSQALEQVAEEKPELKIYSVCVDTEAELAKKMKVMMAPSLLFVKAGVTKKKSLGYKSKESILEMLETYFQE